MLAKNIQYVVMQNVDVEDSVVHPALSPPHRYDYPSAEK